MNVQRDIKLLDDPLGLYKRHTSFVYGGGHEAPNYDTCGQKREVSLASSFEYNPEN
jgi:hypothetical protein